MESVCHADAVGCDDGNGHAPAEIVAVGEGEEVAAGFPAVGGGSVRDISAEHGDENDDVVREIGIGILYYHKVAVVVETGGYLKLVEKAAHGGGQEGLAVEDPEQIKAVKFDYLLIAIEDVRTSKQIEHMLTEWGVEREKIVQMNEEQASE